jgi:hypothetical protein
LDGNPARFKAPYEILIVKTLCDFIAVGVMRGCITGMIPGCRVFGINYGKRGRGVAIAPGTGMPGFPVAPRETTLIPLCSLPAAAAALWRPCRDKGKAGGGGRAAFREESFCRARFNAAIGDTGKYQALFSRGMGEAGTGLCHRYRGIAAAGTAVSSGFLPAPACPPFFPEVPDFGGDCLLTGGSPVPLLFTGMDTAVSRVSPANLYAAKYRPACIKFSGVL